MTRELLELSHRDAELRVCTGRTHMVMMATANARIDSREDLAIAKQIRPCGQRIQVVHGHPYTALERPGIFVSRREVGRIENPPRIQVGEQLQRALQGVASVPVGRIVFSFGAGNGVPEGDAISEDDLTAIAEAWFTATAP